MKKIMFNDKYSLTQAVLDGRKTNTRRIVTYPKKYKGIDVAGFYAYRRMSDEAILELCMYDEEEIPIDEGQILPKYKEGEIIAVAQSYKTIDDFYQAAFSRNHSIHGMTVTEFDGISDEDIRKWNMVAVNYRGKKIWTNKFYVKPELMLHFIRITNVRIERLQDISDEDCLKEGVELNTRQYEYDGTKYFCVRGLGHWRSIGCYNFNTPREAYAALIDKISGKGTWESNPYVFVYDFELIK